MKLSLIEHKKLFDDVDTFVFKPDEQVDWLPGQYMHYVFPHPNEDDRGEERWFTISAPPYQKNITITTRFNEQKSSSFKKALRNLKTGDSVQADGPKGKFIYDDSSKKSALVAGGIGITPYRAMLLQMDHDGQQINADLLYANRDEKFVFGDELEALTKKHPNFHIKKFIGERHIEAGDLKPYADDPNVIIYLSGPEPMIEKFEETLKDDLKVPEERVKTDFFPGYPAEL
jgi:ferredoxin-NADP reductase